MLPVHPIAPVKKIDKKQKEQEDKNKKKKHKTFKEKGIPDNTSNLTDLFSEEESIFDQSI